jgi:predicted HD phosphohydrolase
MFRSIADATSDDWRAVCAAQDANRHRREHDALLCLLHALAGVTDGFAVDQLRHCLQTASRAERAGAPEWLVLVALLHDVGKPLSLTNHPAVAAEVLRERLGERAYRVLLHHGEFLADHTHGTFTARDRHAGEPWHGDAVRLAEWDAAGFDPDYPALPLEHFLPMLARAYGLEGG